MAEEAEPAAATVKCCAARVSEKCYDIRDMMGRYNYLPTKAGSELGAGKHVCRYGKCMEKGGHVAASRAKAKAAPAPAALHQRLRRRLHQHRHPHMKRWRQRGSHGHPPRSTKPRGGKRGAS